jgi:polyhydroxyalkanoate synthesis regulator phasin
MTRDQELEFLKTESQALREELKELEDRIGQLSAERK